MKNAGASAARLRRPVRREARRARAVIATGGVCVVLVGWRGSMVSWRVACGREKPHETARTATPGAPDRSIACGRWRARLVPPSARLLVLAARSVRLRELANLHGRVDLEPPSAGSDAQPHGRCANWAAACRIAHRSAGRPRRADHLDEAAGSSPADCSGPTGPGPDCSLLRLLSRSRRSLRTPTHTDHGMLNSASAAKPARSPRVRATRAGPKVSSNEKGTTLRISRTFTGINNTSTEECRPRLHLLRRPRRRSP